jgi:hypothetical protein
MEKRMQKEKPVKAHQKKGNAFDRALKQVRWLDDYRGPIIEREVELYTTAAQAQFVRSFYITERNLIYLDSCHFSHLDEVREASITEEAEVNEAIKDAVEKLEQIHQEVRAIPMADSHLRKPVPDQGRVLILTALGGAHFEAILKLDETVIDIEHRWLERAISNEARETLIQQGRRALDRVYEASHRGYLRVSAVYNRVRH